MTDKNKLKSEKTEYMYKWNGNLDEVGRHKVVKA